MWRRLPWVVALVVGVCLIAWLFFGRSRGSERADRARPPRQTKTTERTTPESEARSASATARTSPPNGAGTLAGAVSSTAPPLAGNAPLPIAEIRAVLTEDPALAEQLARADQERFPDRPDADERDALLVAAVYNQKQPTRARKEARRYFRTHPDGRFKDFLQKWTGASVPPGDP